MNAFGKLFAGLFLLVLASLSFASAYSYYPSYNGFSSSYYTKEVIDQNRYSYVSRDSYDGAYGSVTNYKRVDDYSQGYYRPMYSGYSYRNYNNQLGNYMHDGSRTGYSNTQYRYLGSGYDDSYQRTVYGSNYHPYYYEPYYNGQYYDNSYRGCGYNYC